MFPLYSSRTAAVAAAFLVAALTCCSANPNADDAARVKKRFLELRFSAPFQARFRALNDPELFQISCEQMRVNCARVLELVRSSDPEFYTKLSKPN